MSKNNIIINGIDVSEYFIDVVDEGGSTIDYKILPNSERLLVEKIFEQNQQLARLQEENKRLQMLSCANCGEKYLSPDGAELYEKNVQLQKENEGLKKKKDEYYLRTLDYETKISYLIQTLEEIKKISKQCMTKGLCSIDCDYADRCYIEDAEVPTYDICKLIIGKISEVLNDRD